GGDALARPFSRHLQPRAAPEPVGAAEAQRMSVTAQKDGDAPIAVTRILRREFGHARERRRILVRHARAVAQARSRHPQKRAGPPLRQSFVHRVFHPSPASRHAHHFFAAISFITSISRSRSASSFLSFAFSASSCLKRRTSDASNVPNRLRQV